MVESLAMSPQSFVLLMIAVSFSLACVSVENQKMVIDSLY